MKVYIVQFVERNKTYTYGAYTTFQNAYDGLKAHNNFSNPYGGYYRILRYDMDVDYHDDGVILYTLNKDWH